MSKVRIALDPGHGNSPGPGYDPGVVDSPSARAWAKAHGLRPAGGRATNRHEAAAALEMSLTLRFVLEASGRYETRLTRTAAGTRKTAFSTRIRESARWKADAFLSVHYNQVGSYAGVYWSPGLASRQMARLLDLELARVAPDHVWPSTESNHGGLYLDAWPDSKPAVLLEVSAIDRAPPAGYAGKAERLAVAYAVQRALDAFYSL